MPRHMKNLFNLLFLMVLAITTVSCEADDELVNLDHLQAPANLGASFDISQDNSGLVTITPTGEGVNLFHIDFGDGSPSAEGVKVGQSVEHVYEEGQYEVVITGINLAGKTAQGAQPLTVSFLPPENLGVEITRDPQDNYTIWVSASAENAARFEVYFGEEEQEEPVALMEGESISHTYQSIGTYQVRVVALSGGAATSEVTSQVQITDPLFLPIDFESQTLAYTFINFGGGDADGAPIVENPAPDAVNDSPKVASYTKVAGSEGWAGTQIILDEPIDFATRRYIKMDVWSPIEGAEVLLKVENLENADLNAEIRVPTTTSNQWETMLFDMTAIDPGVEYGRIVFFFNMDVPGTGETYYFDNIETTRLELLQLPVDFESQSLSYNWQGFGGASGAVVDNPYREGINTSGRVAQLDKAAGAQGWAGMTLSLDEPVDFTGGQVVRMKVYGPRSGTSILLKLEDSESAPNEEGNPSVFVELPVSTTTSGQWEELLFDFGSAAGFDPGTPYDNLIVFYDFGNPGQGERFYFDDIRVGSAQEPTTVVLPVNFENTSLSYVYEGFEGADAAIEANPFQEGLNTSSRVMRTTKTEGAMFYAGTTLQLEAPIDFSVAQQIKMKSYSPKAGIPVRMKLENNTNPGIFLEVDASTGVAHQWEELVFDFSGLDTDQEFHKVIVFYEFVPDLPGDGTTYYYDDIQLNP